MSALLNTAAVNPDSFSDKPVSVVLTASSLLLLLLLDSCELRLLLSSDNFELMLTESDLLEVSVPLLVEDSFNDAKLLALFKSCCLIAVLFNPFNPTIVTSYIFH